MTNDGPDDTTRAPPLGQSFDIPMFYDGFQSTEMQSETNVI